MIFVIFEQISAICLHTYLKGIFHQITSYGHTKISHEECSKSGKNLKIKLKLCGSWLYLHKWMKTSSKMNQNSSLLLERNSHIYENCSSFWIFFLEVKHDFSKFPPWIYGFWIVHFGYNPITNRLYKLKSVNL